MDEKENRLLLDKRIEELNISSELVLAFDFDEMVIPTHLCRAVTTPISRNLDKAIVAKLGHTTLAGINYIMEQWAGTTYERYKQVRDKVISSTPWTQGFDEVIPKMPGTIVFISSGLKDVCAAKLSQIGFDERNILAGEFTVKEGGIYPSLVVDEELKGYIVDRLREKHRVIGVGHSLGDKVMLDRSHISIAVKPSTPNLAQHTVSSAYELLDLIKKLS